MDSQSTSPETDKAFPSILGYFEKANREDLKAIGIQHSAEGVELRLLAVSLMSGAVAAMGASRYGISPESVIPAAASAAGPGAISLKRLFNRQQG